MKELEVDFEKIVGEGKSLGRKDGKVIFAYGVLPGERAIVRSIIEKKNYIEAEVVEIKTKSEWRVEPRENHFLSCSPWQIINYDKQCEFKKKLIEESLFQTSKENIRVDRFYPSDESFGYRTKIEYSFSEENGKIFLAFHKRGDYSRKVVLDKGCALIGDDVNKIALDILELINKSGIKSNLLKTLIIRRARNTSDIVASLFVKDEGIRFDFSDKRLKGFNLVYSNPLSSVSNVDKIISKTGSDFLVEKIFNKSFSYGFDCFFQNNITLFDSAISEIKKFVSGAKKVLDLYCGVGVIGLSLSDSVGAVELVESNKSSYDYAVKNIESNSIKNANAYCSIDSKLAESFYDSDALILDPPRAGLHKNVIKNIMKTLPAKIAYLSCNPMTQGRDLTFLLEKYVIENVAGFDFYPNTPHIENLITLKKK
jgi:23S rRNA (uracil1939-C5)-methyltransferase